jgi:hypothetical protein
VEHVNVREENPENPENPEKVRRVIKRHTIEDADLVKNKHLTILCKT